MSILKSALRLLLRDYIIKAPVIHYKDRISNRDSIRYEFIEPNQSRGFNEHGSYLKLMVSGGCDANEIATILNGSKDSLRVAKVSDPPLCSDSNDSQDGQARSVLLKVSTRDLLTTAYQMVDPVGLRNSIIDGENDQFVQEKVVIDFSSPNLAKPFHFGHLKSTILGNFLANINSLMGHRVIKINYVGDWGTQYGLLSVGLDHYEDLADIDKSDSPLKVLLEAYVKANSRAHEEESFFDLAKKRYNLMDKSRKDLSQEGHKHLKRWAQIKDISMRELKLSYERLGIEFDHFEFESDYSQEADTIVEKMKANGTARRLDDGVVVVDLTKNGKSFEVPVQKRDSSSLYLTRDVAAAVSRMERFEFDKMLYVVDTSQERHFHYLGEMIDRLGYSWRHKLIHVKMARVVGLSSRSGTTELLSDIIDKASQLYQNTTRRIVTSKVDVENPSELERTSLQLALTALFISDLRNSRFRHYKFSLQDLELEGKHSGINLQTTHARLCSLLSKCQDLGLQPLKCMDEAQLESIESDDAGRLLCRLCELDTALHHSYWSMDAVHLVEHAMQLSRAINRSLKSKDLRVLDESLAMRSGWSATRLSLFQLARDQLRLIIRLVGLKPLDRV